MNQIQKRLEKAGKAIAECIIQISAKEKTMLTKTTIDLLNQTLADLSAGQESFAAHLQRTFNKP